MRQHCRLAAFFVVLCGSQPVAAASITTFSGIDSNLASTSAPRPNSEAALVAFQAAVSALGQSVSTNDFETAPLTPGALPNGVPVDLGAGLTMTLGNTSSATSSGNTFSTGIRSSANPVTAMFPQFGFNTTAGGAQFLRIVTQSISPDATTHATVTFDFATSVDAFGLSLTGLGSNDGSAASLHFVDGSSQVLPIAGGNISGTSIETEFFGFVDAGALISSVVFDLQYTNLTRGSSAYLLGIDDLRFATPVPAAAVPEPSSALLLVTGLAVTQLWRRYSRPRALSGDV